MTDDPIPVLNALRDQLVAGIADRGGRSSRRPIVAMAAASVVFMVAAGLVLAARSGSTIRHVVVLPSLGGGQPSSSTTAGATTATTVTSQPTLSISASSTSPAVGDLVTFTVTERGGAVVDSVVPDFGDGSPNRYGNSDLGHACGAVTPAADRTRTYVHAYAKPGPFIFSAAATVFDPCGPPSANSNIAANVRMTVTGRGAPVANGPEEPQGVVVVVPVAGDSHLAAGTFDGGDSDGFVRSLQVDWGDGTTLDVKEQPLDQCAAGPNGWPSPNSPPGPVNVQHRYPSAGSYRVTLTVTSTGCDGTSPQQAATSFAMTIP